MPTLYSEPGVINALDTWGGLAFGMVAGSMSAAADNAQALQAAINEAQTGGQGAIVLIPSFSGSILSPQYGPYYIDTSGLTGQKITIPSSGTGTPLLICGTGPGTTLIMLTPNTRLFEADSSSYVTFQDLTVVDASAETSTTSLGTAFYFNSKGVGTSQGYKLFRVNIVDFPQAIHVVNQVYDLDILECTVSYDDSYSGVSCISMFLSGAQINVEQCVFDFAGPSASGMMAVQVTGSSYVRLTDSEITGFETGIEIGQISGAMPAIGSRFTGLDIECTGPCVSMVAGVYDASFVNCSFQPASGSSPTVGIKIPSSSSNANFDTIRFTACTVTGYVSHGLELSSGQNVQVNGGSFSGNGTAGIAIIGPATEIQITGANCIGTSNSGATQQYGFT